MIEKIHESSLLLFVFLFRPNSQFNCKIILFEIRMLRWWKSYSFCIVGKFLLRKGCPTLDACNWSFQKLALKIWTSRKPKYQRHIISLNLNPEKNCSPSKCSRKKRYCDQNWNFFFKSQFRHEMSQTAFLILWNWYPASGR